MLPEENTLPKCTTMRQSWVHFMWNLRWSFLDSPSISRIAVGLLLVTLQSVWTKKVSYRSPLLFLQEIFHSGSGVSYMSLLHCHPTPPHQKKWKKGEIMTVNCLVTIAYNPSLQINVYFFPCLVYMGPLPLWGFESHVEGKMHHFWVVRPVHQLQAREKGIRWPMASIAEYTTEHLKREKLKSHTKEMFWPKCTKSEKVVFMLPYNLVIKLISTVTCHRLPK